MFLQLLLVVALAATPALSEQARFDHYEVYRVVPDTAAKLAALRSLEQSPDGLSFWSEPRRVGAAVDIMVPPHKKPDFQQLVAAIDVEATVLMANVQEFVDNVNPINAPKAMEWTSYHRIDEINEWLASLATSFPDNVTPLIGGESYEGRQLHGVRVSYGPDRPGIFIEAGIHAREWIAPATVTFILNEVLTSNDTHVRQVVEAFDWYVFPSANPDGYEFTHTTDRLWRKTRSPNDGICAGTDPNRNWNFHWGENGSSNWTCSETYHGSAPFSEIETRTLSEFISVLAEQGKINVYLAMHSYGQQIMYPYGLESIEIPDVEQHMSIGTNAAAAMAQRFGTEYEVGSLVGILYESSGGSMDWIKGTYDVDVVYTIELRDHGRYTFLLPANQIIPSGEETLDAVVSILQDTLGLVAKRQ